VFDKAPHCRLISELSSYSVNDQLILWIEDFLLHILYIARLLLCLSVILYVFVLCVFYSCCFGVINDE